MVPLRVTQRAAIEQILPISVDANVTWDGVFVKTVFNWNVVASVPTVAAVWAKRCSCIAPDGFALLVGDAKLSLYATISAIAELISR